MILRRISDTVVKKRVHAERPHEYYYHGVIYEEPTWLGYLFKVLHKQRHYISDTGYKWYSAETLKRAQPNPWSADMHLCNAQRRLDERMCIDELRQQHWHGEYREVGQWHS